MPIGHSQSLGRRHAISRLADPIRGSAHLGRRLIDALNGRSTVRNQITH
jgi:hypothetical protein